MLHLRISKLTLTVALLFVLALSSLSFSQYYCYWDNWELQADVGWWNHKVPTQYALSVDQVKKLNKIRSQFSEKILPLQNELRSLRMEYRAYAMRSDADIDQLKDYRKEIRKIEDKIEDYRLELRKNINNILTKEQRIYFNQNGYGWWDGTGNWWHKEANNQRMGMRMNHHCCW